VVVRSGDDGLSSLASATIVAFSESRHLAGKCFPLVYHGL
jgi:hypothetical protein